MNIKREDDRRYYKINDKNSKMEEKRIIAYKGFDENLCCRGFQYEVGREYEQNGGIECCHNGFHACINPFDVLNYYNANGKSRFCEVEQMGIIRTDSNDTKQSSSKIKIKAEIGMEGLFKAGIEWIKEKTNPMTVIKDTEGKGNNPSRNSAQIGSSGDCAQIESTGEDSVICCAGQNSMVKAKIGSWITLSEWKYSEESNATYLFALRLNMLMANVSRLILGTNLLMESLKKCQLNHPCCKHEWKLMCDASILMSPVVDIPEGRLFA